LLDFTFINMIFLFGGVSELREFASSGFDNYTLSHKSQILSKAWKPTLKYTEAGQAEVVMNTKGNILHSEALHR
jgi:hypothetical protein